MSDLSPQLAQVPDEGAEPELSPGDSPEYPVAQNGVAKLLLTLVELVRQLLERQALRRYEKDDLNKDETERLGMALIRLKSEIEQLSKTFGVQKADLNLTLGALVKSGSKSLDEASLVDLLDTCIQKGVVVAGKATVSVADVDLIGLDLYAVLHPVRRKASRS